MHDFKIRWHFNSATALLMELVNEIQAQEPLEDGVRPEVAREVFELLILMLASHGAAPGRRGYGKSSATRKRHFGARRHGLSLCRNWPPKIRWKLWFRVNGRVRGESPHGSWAGP